MDAGWRLDNPTRGANRQPRAAREQCELVASGKSDHAESRHFDVSRILEAWEASPSDSSLERLEPALVFYGLNGAKRLNVMNGLGP